MVIVNNDCHSHYDHSLPKKLAHTSYHIQRVELIFQDAVQLRKFSRDKRQDIQCTHLAMKSLSLDKLEEEEA